MIHGPGVESVGSSSTMPWWIPAHELRNEVVEELNSDLVSQSGANLDSKLVKGNKTSGRENEKGGKGEKSGERGQGNSLGEASLSEARG